MVMFFSVAISGCSSLYKDVYLERSNQALKNENLVEDTKTSEIIKIKVIAKNFSFEPKEIKAKIGQKIKIEFVNQQGFHDFVVDEFNIATKKINEGQTDIIEFVPNKKGQFEYYCSIGNHRQMGMVGKFIIE